jgi:hypothetical protein
MGYYRSDKPDKGYNYSKISFDGIYFYRLIYELEHNIKYYDYYYFTHHDSGTITKITCNRCANGSCKRNKKCILCTQLNKIQRRIFRKDPDVAAIFKNRQKYEDGYVLIRERKPRLNFKFDYTGYDISYY